MSGVTYAYPPRRTTRGLIADLVADALQPVVQPYAGDADRGFPVYRTRTWPLQLENLPAVAVYAMEGAESLASASSADSRWKASCTLVVQCVVSEEDPVHVERAMDGFAWLITDTVLCEPRLIGREGMVERVSSVRVKATQKAPADQGENFLGEVTVAFAMEWSEERESRSEPVCADGYDFQFETPEGVIP